MQLQTYAKIGIIAGIASLVILTPFIAVSAYVQHEFEFARLFANSDKPFQEMKAKDSFKNFLERYPDAQIIERDRRHNIELEVIKFSDITGNQLRLNMGYDFWDDIIYEHANCEVFEREIRQQLGPMSDTELRIPPTFYKEGNAHDQYTAEFIKNTNCLEIGKSPEISQEIPVESLKTTHYIAIPQGTSMPGCEEANECYNPYSITVKEGSVIEWQNFDDAAHTVTSGYPEDGPDGYFDTGLFMSQESFKFQLKKAGTYDYFCMVHPWMTGQIIVDPKSENEN